MAEGAAGVRQRRREATRVRGDEAAHAPLATEAAPSRTAAALPWLHRYVPVACACIAVRVGCALVYRLIPDCDQTFNYEEPTHYLLYGSGQQTWEYDPHFALRSYAYVGFHALLSWLVGAAWGADKIAVFHRTHVAIGVLCALAEAAFITALARRFGSRVAGLTAAFMLTSAGMAHASGAYLPSTTSMIGLTAAWAAWLRKRVHATIALTACALVFGWPFAAVAILPLAGHLLITTTWWRLAVYGLLWLGITVGVCVAVDAHFYRRLLIAPWNIILYNAFGVGGGGQGADLYGVEPATFYLHNLALNFNVQLPAALAAFAALPVLAWRAAVQRSETAGARLTLLAQAALWLGLMSSRPHKEERFMFVVFPLLSFAAACSVDALAAWLSACACRGPRAAYSAACSRLLVGSVLVVSVLLSGARIAAQVHNFSAPFSAWTSLGRYLAAPPHAAAPPLAALPVYSAWQETAHVLLPPHEHALLTLPVLPVHKDVVHGVGVRVCVGKEWYRFPASHFLPQATRAGSTYAQHAPWAGDLPGRVPGGAAELRYVRDGFTGQLPQAFAPVNGTWAAATGFNDENREEPSRYVPLASCDFLVDFWLPADGVPPSETPCACEDGTEAGRRWRTVWSAPFLHAPSSPALTRALYIPGYSPARNVYGVYVVGRQEACTCV